MGGVVSTLNRTGRESLSHKVTFGQILEEDVKGSHVDKQKSIPGRGNNKLKDPGQHYSYHARRV